VNSQSIDHGCPQGCDDAGRIIGKVEATENGNEWLFWIMTKAQVDEAANCVGVNPANLTEDDYRVIMRDFENGILWAVDGWQLVLQCSIQKWRDDTCKSGNQRSEQNASVTKKARTTR
jgi:hypothetical protein